MYEDLDADELLEWEAMYGIDPWGEERADLRNGILCSLTDACHRTRGQPDAPMAYMPYVRALRNEGDGQPEEEMREILDSASASWGE